MFFGFRFNVADFGGDLLQAVLVISVLVLQFYSARSVWECFFQVTSEKD